MLDSVPQLQDVKTEKAVLSALDKEKIKYYFKDVETLDSSDSVQDLKILKHTKIVMDAHPEDIAILRLSKYGKYVSEVEEAEAKAKKEANA